MATDSSGEVTEYYDYYSYGSELTSTQLGSTAADHTFTDKELDDDLGLYYFEARWYDSDIGRFSSQDPAQLDNRAFKILADPQSLNFYDGVEWDSENPWDVTYHNDPITPAGLAGEVRNMNQSEDIEIIDQENYTG